VRTKLEQAILSIERNPEIDHVLPGNGNQYLLSDVTLPRVRQ
jgi:hypothetical protein